MQIEAGKYYRTRDGQKAFVAYVGRPFGMKTQYPVLGFLDCGDETQCESWTDDGRWSSARSSGEDLIEPWIDPWDYQPQEGDTVWVLHAGSTATFLLSRIVRADIEHWRGRGARFAKAEVSPPPPAV